MRLGTFIDYLTSLSAYQSLRRALKSGEADPLDALENGALNRLSTSRDPQTGAKVHVINSIVDKDRDGAKTSACFAPVD